MVTVFTGQTLAILQPSAAEAFHRCGHLATVERMSNKPKDQDTQQFTEEDYLDLMGEGARRDFEAD